MFNIEKLCDSFYALVKIPEKDKAMVKDLGAAATEQVKNNLKPGANLESGEQNLLMLCVALTFYQYVLIGMNEQPESIRVGDVSICGGKQAFVSAAQQLINHYSQATKGYMKAKFVDFRSV
ncbi:MAG: hypothetical protein LBJ38_01325 [Oscillospiraceae bacterium]|jgi:hypothetical protein|nr:hypothetical protein [Oscillospiraceae bacterium]